MSKQAPKISVIMPVYNGAEYLARAIRSVLEQTVDDLELVIANDGSTDDSDEIIRGIDDPRLKYVAFERNRGADAARRAALRESTAPFVALLDQDDEFHPQKLEAHLDYVERNPSADILYNSRYDLLCSGRGVGQMFRPPAEVGLADFILGFPISPSEMSARREIVMSTIDSDDIPFHGGEILWYGRQRLDGTRFGFIDRPLNYRRHHPGRRYRDIEGICTQYIECQNTILDDPRCPEQVRSIRTEAHTNSYAIWGVHALAQGESELGQRLLREAIKLTPSLVQGRPSALAQRLAQFAITDDTRDHEALLGELFARLPAEAQAIGGELDWAVRQGLLIDATLALLWDRPDDARAKLDEARRRGAQVDDVFIATAAYHLNHFESHAGGAEADAAAARLADELAKLGARTAGRRLRGSLSLDRAFRDYQAGRRRGVPASVLQAMAGNPASSLNRGAWSILVRSLLERTA